MIEPVEKITWGRPPDMPEIEVLTAENSRRAWCVYHQTYTICTILDHGGLTEWRYRRKANFLYQHNLMLMEPGEVHRTVRHTGMANFHVVQLAPSLVEAMAREVGVESPPHWSDAQAARPEIFQAFARFHAALARKGSLLERQSRLTQCVHLLLLNHSERAPARPALLVRAGLARARDYLHAHAAEHIALADLAQLAGLSRFHFLRLFSRHFGIPPHAYQVNLRIEMTRGLLRAGVPVQAIEAGFADQSHLTRHFKRQMKVTPGQYAAMLRPGARQQ